MTQTRNTTPAEELVSEALGYDNIAVAEQYKYFRELMATYGAHSMLEACQVTLQEHFHKLIPTLDLADMRLTEEIKTLEEVVPPYATDYISRLEETRNSLPWRVHQRFLRTIFQNIYHVVQTSGYLPIAWAIHLGDQPIDVIHASMRHTIYDVVDQTLEYYMTSHEVSLLKQL